MEIDRVRDPSQAEYGELPELTRTLRALGSARRGGGAGSSFFLPLVEARRRAAEARSAVACLRAFDATPLARALDQAIDRIVADWPDARESARRALRAELVERVSGYLGALKLLTERAHVVMSSDEATRLAAWRSWTVQLAATFDAA